MKKVAFLILSIMLSSCGNDINKKPESTKDTINTDFTSKFEQKTLPLIFSTNDFTPIEELYLHPSDYSKFGVINPDTSGGENYYCKYFISVSNKFNLTVLNYSDAGMRNSYLYSISDSNNKIDKIEFADFSDMGGDGNTTLTTTSTISKDLKINITKKEITIMGSVYIGDEIIANIISKEYQISNKGKFNLVKTTNIDTTYIDVPDTIKKHLDYLYNITEKFNNIKSVADIDYILSVQADIYEAFTSNLSYSQHFEYLAESNSPEHTNAPTVARVNKWFPYVLVYNYDGGIDAELNYYPLYEKSKITPEKDDDIFFDIYLKINKIYTYNKGTKDSVRIISESNELIYRESEEIQYSKLGNGTFLEIIKDIENINKESTYFKTEIKKLSSEVFNNLTYTDMFLLPKQDVLIELDKISTEINFLEQDKKSFDEYYSKIKNLDDKSFNYGKKLFN